MGQKGTKPLSPEKLAEESPDSSVVIWEITGSCGESAAGGVSGDVLVIPLLPGCEVSVLVSGSVDAAPASIGGSSPPGAVFIIFL